MNPPITNRAKQAWTIEIQDRYFVKFGSKGQVQTAWSMCGGQLFICRGNLKDVIEKLEAKNKKYTVKLVEVKEPNPAPFYSVREFYELRSRLERLHKNHSQSLPSKAVHTLPELVTITTLQWNAAWNESDSRTRTELDCFFAYERLGGEQFSLEERLSMFKADKRDRENGFDPDIPF
ncbi:MAG: hypothetical protein HRU48_15595 [Vibrio sp.]|uniref:hypothetical protein n=1 Tax=Vibrio sp. TaxID=678 RepID=UPI001EBB5F2E|nr:hypothetical protein [Vibrio sp.]NRB68771.1 hypothetical protein [Vibrio sp.]